MSEIVATVKMLQEVVKGTIPVAKAIGDSEGNTINTTYATKTELQTETSNRQAADETLQSNIETETTQRQAADQTLQNNINTANAAIETLDNNAVKKTGETNQIIAGDVQIQGDLTVNGTTYTTNTETLMVNDNLIVANAAGTNLNNLSGLAIRTNSTDAYGILYDPATSSVKLGLGSLSDDNEFTFDTNEGNSIAVRSQDTEWTDGHVVEWNAAERKFVDSGIALDNIVTISGTQTISGAKTFSETIQGDVSGTAGKVAHKLTITTGDTVTEFDGSSDQSVEIELGDATDPNAVHFTQQTLTSEQQSQARTNIGAAAQSTANGGFAGGSGASATTGAAIGSNAQATADGAVQLGAGTNSAPNTLQFRNFQLCDDNGQIPAERLNNVPSKITGGASSIATDDLSENRALVSSSSGKVMVSSITATELSYLDGAKSNIQQQIDDLGSGTIVKTAAEWASDNTVLEAGQFGYDSTNKITKIGDGFLPWEILPTLLTTKVSFEKASWSDIAALSESGNADKYFSVGDEKTIELTTGEKVTLVILGFNHDDLTSGGKAGMTIGMKNLLATKYRMNATATNEGGWNESEMRTSTMATLLSQLPSDLQGVIKQVNKKATAGGASTSITTSADKLWLFAEVEVDGTTSAGYANEGEQYEYWKTVKDGTVAADRIKYLSNGSGSAGSWWLRSPYVSSSNSFRSIFPTGTVGYSNVNGNYGVSFGFCV